VFAPFTTTNAKSINPPPSSTKSAKKKPKSGTGMFAASPYAQSLISKPS
jgi:hypothetical protein